MSRNSVQASPCGNCASAGQGSVVQGGDAGCGGGQSVSGAAVVTQNVVGLEPGQPVFNTGADAAVPGVVGLFPGRQVATVGGSAVPDDHLRGAAGRAVGHDLTPGQGVGDTAAAVDDGVGAVARLRVTAGDDQPGAGVDGDLPVGRGAVVLRPRRPAVLAGRDQGAVDDRDRAAGSAAC